MREENLTYVWTSNFYVSEKDGIRGDKKGVKEKGIVSEYFSELNWFGQSVKLPLPCFDQQLAEDSRSLRHSLKKKIARRIHIDQCCTSRVF